jgi:integration host factor subunit alpha
VKRSRVSWAERTIGRDELSDAAHNASGVSANQAKAVVNQVVEEIAATLERGETVMLTPVGSFTVHQKKARLGCNPRTGEPARISARRVLRFKPSPVLKMG